jgi:signal transduction histidine kinase
MGFDPKEGNTQGDIERGEGDLVGTTSILDASMQVDRAEVDLLLRLTEAVNRAETAEEVYEPALDAVLGGLEVDRAAVLLIDPDGVMRFKSSRGLSPGYRAAVEGHSPWPADARDPEPVVVADVELDPAWQAYLELFRREGIRALGFVPLTHDHRLLGKFMLYSAAPRDFTERELERAQMIAAQVAQAVARQHLLGSERAARRGAEQSADRLRRLLKVTASLSRAATVEEIAKVVVTEGAWATGALTGGLWLIAEDGTHAALVHDLGYSKEGRWHFRHVPLASPMPMPLLDSLRDGEAVWVESRAKLQERYPALAGVEAVRADQAIACLPIVASGRPVGALSFTFASAADIDQAQRDFLLTIAYQSEVALERARLFERERAGREEAEAAQRRASFKAEASAVLASSLDYATTLRNVAKLAIPRFADGCVVELRDASGATSVVAVEHVDPSKVELVRRLRELDPSPGDPLLDSASVLRVGTAVLHADLGGDLRAVRPQEGSQLELVLALGLRSAITVPMLVHGRAIGVMSFIRGEAARRYNDADLETAVMLGQRAAFAVDNARLHSDLQRAVVARDDLIGVVSHDLRNLLGVMAMSAQGMVKKVSQGPEGEKVKRLAAAMKRTTARMDRLIHDLLDFGGIESGRLKLDPQPEDVNMFFAPLLEDLRPLATAKGIRLRVEPPGSTLAVRCDRQRVFQVLSNLVGNAIKFTPSDGTILVEARPDGGSAVFGVHDTGPGIGAAHLPKIFDRYYQGDGRDGGGVGLGLFISRGIVEAHGGRIWVESAPGTGSHFFFTLPRLSQATASTDAAE